MRRWHVGFMCFSKLTVTAIVLLMIVGCHMGEKIRIISTPPTLPYKVADASDPANIAMQKRFIKSGVKVISLGQDYLVSIPASTLFPNQSPQLNWGSYALLNDVACFLKQFRKISISVTSYSNECVSPPRERALTLARSRAVADYLWSQGIDSRFIFTHGLGSDKPIFRSDQGGDQSPNSRIEITFRDAVA